MLVFDPKVVVHGNPKLLLAAQVPLCGLYLAED